MNAKTYDAHELIEALIAQFPNAQFPAVMNFIYCAPTRGWVEKQFGAYMWNFEQARGQLEWANRGGQCEHFALRAALEVVDLFRQMPDDQVPKVAESIAVAAVKYQKGAMTPSLVWHEVNLWFLDGVWCPWEPQQRRFFEFTEAERLTVYQAIIP